MRQLHLRRKAIPDSENSSVQSVSVMRQGDPLGPLVKWKSWENYPICCSSSHSKNLYYLHLEVNLPCSVVNGEVSVARIVYLMAFWFLDANFPNVKELQRTWVEFSILPCLTYCKSKNLQRIHLSLHQRCDQKNWPIFTFNLEKIMVRAAHTIFLTESL